MRRTIFSMIAVGLSLALTGCFPLANRSDAGSSGNGFYETLPPKLPDPDNFTYYPTLEEAVAHNTNEVSTVTYIGEKIKLFENDKYAVLFFKSNVHGKDTLYVFKFYVREIDGSSHYSPPIVCTDVMWKAHKESVQDMKIDAIGEVRLCIARDNLRIFRVDGTKNFFWGISQSPKAMNLKIEGQPATEVIPVKMDGDTAYFWNFADLNTDKKPVFQDIQKYVKGDFVITMD